jgi:hypothetical protein
MDAVEPAEGVRRDPEIDPVIWYSELRRSLTVAEFDSSRATAGIRRKYGPMRWLMIAFLVSLAALLLAAAGLARHIWLQRAQVKLRAASSGLRPEAKEIDTEPEP